MVTSGTRLATLEGMGKLAACTFALLVSGCNTVTLVDDIDLELDFSPLVGPSDDLHSPYVQGSSTTLFVHNTDSRQKQTGWTLESSAPSVFFISNVAHDSDSGRLSASGQALAAGTADLIVRNEGGDILRRQPIDVKVPDRVELLAHGQLLIGRSDHDADVTEARIQAGGTATYLARYWLGPQQLYGNGALSVMAPPDVDGHVEPTFLFENRDWLQLTPADVGTFTVDLLVGGTTPTHVAGLTLQAVPASDVTSIRILGMDESHASKGQWLVALAQASDAQARTVFGVEYEWQIDGTTQLGLGDLYRYKFDPKLPVMLSAHVGGMFAETPIHSGGGFVDSTNNVGCSYTPGAAPTAGWLLLLLFWIYPLRMSRYIRQLLLAGSSAITDSHSTRASSLRPRE